MATKPKNAVPATPPLYDRIRNILESARASVARTVNTTQVVANWLIGREIVEEEQAGKRRAVYGAELLRDLAARLNADFGSGYGVDNLELFRRLYLEYPQLLPEANSDAARRKSGLLANSETVRRKSVAAPEIQHAVRDESWRPGRLNPNLSWTHYRSLLRVDRAEARTFYEIEATGNAWSPRELERQIIGDHFYIDLVFYHTILKCYVLIDLKVGKLTHADLGQIQFNVNYYDRERRTEGDNPTHGLILCPDKNDAVVRYTLGEQLKRNIFTSRYQLYLPTVEELRRELRRELRYLAPDVPKPATKRTRKSGARKP
jgi:hypothetical protein